MPLSNCSLGISDTKKAKKQAVKLLRDFKFVVTDLFKTQLYELLGNLMQIQ